MITQYCNGGPGIQKSGCLQLFKAGEVPQAIQTEVIQETRACAPGERAPGGLAASSRPDPARFQQAVQDASGQGHSAHLFNLCSRNWLLIGDVSERFRSRAG